MKVDIRRISRSDAEGFRACLDAVVREGRFLAMQEAPSLESVAEFLGNNVDMGYPQYVAAHDGRIIGWCGAVPSSRFGGTRHRATLGMGVLAGWRGMGLGKSLLEAVIRHTWAVGLTRIDLEVRADNDAAIGLYEKFGFRREGRKVAGMRVADRYYDLLLMGLLNEAAMRSSGERP